MSEWLYGENLLEKYSKNHLSDLLRTGILQPYNANGKPVYLPQEFNEYFHFYFLEPKGEYRNKRLNEIYEKNFPGETEYNENKWPWKSLWLPEDIQTEIEEKLFLMLQNFKFKKSDFDNAIEVLNKSGKPKKKSAAPKPRINQFRIIMEKALKYFEKQNNDKKPSFKEIFKMIKYDNEHGIESKYDPEGTIQEIKNNVIYYKDSKGEEKELSKKALGQRYKRLIKMLSETINGDH